MKVVHLTTTDHGGAYIAADRINTCLNKEGIDSRLIVRTGTGDTECDEYFAGGMGRFISKAGNLLNLMLSPGPLTTDLFGTDVSRDARIMEADVVVLHWVNSFLSYASIRKLMRSGKPLVWVMHDMWPFTCGYHYLPEDDRGSLIGAYNLRAKRGMLEGGRIIMVGPSRWICDEAAKSPVLEGKRIVNIPNPIDTGLFVRRDKEVLREKYGLDKDKKIILFGAVNLDNKRKGYDLLLEALKGLDPGSCMLCTMGNAPGGVTLPKAYECRNFGFVRDTDMMIDIYSMADVYVIPSRQENLSNSVLEAMSCSLPVAAYDIGGMPDMIRAHENGSLAVPYDPGDLASCIRECLDNEDAYGKAARENVVGNFSMHYVAERYRELLESCKNTDEDLLCAE